MDLSFISTKALNEGNRLSVLKLQQRIAVAQKELSSGRLADVGRTLGARTSEAVSLRQDLSRLNTITDINALVASRLEVSQQALNGAQQTAQSFIGTLIASRNTETGPAVAQTAARAALSGLTDELNTTFAGEHVFAGINTDVQPLTNYLGTPTPANRQALLDAFAAEFGFSPSDALVASIIPSQMQSFIDTTLSALFEEPEWSTTWSQASDENVASRISVSEEIDTSANANDVAFRKLAKSYSMLIDLGVENMTRETYAAVVEKAITFVGEAVQDLAVVQANLGTSQERVTKATVKMDAQMDILTNRINAKESVDPYDAAVRVTSLMTQLETSYSLSARIQNLTILNYLK